MSQSKIPSVQEISIDSRSHQAYRYSLITAFLMAGVVAAMLITFGMPTTIFSTTLWAALVSLAALSSAWLIRQGRNDLGIGLIIGAVQVAIIFPSIETSGLGIAFAAVSISLTLSLSYLMKSRRLATFATISSIVIATLLLSLDLFEPFERIPNTDIAFTWVVGGGVVLAYLTLIARRAWTGGLRNKLMVTFIGLMVVAAGALAVYMFITTTNILKEGLERALAEHTTEAALSIGHVLSEQVNLAKTFALNEILESSVADANEAYTGTAAAIQAELNAKDGQWRTADTGDNNKDPLVRESLTNQAALELREFQEVFPNHVEIFITDVYGGLVGTTNRTSDYYQADEKWWQVAYNNGRGAIYLGEPEFDESVGGVVIKIASPVRDDETGKVMGVLRTTYLVSGLNPILGEKVGETGGTELFIPGEVVSHLHEGQYTPVEPAEYPALQGVANRGMVEMDYEGQASVIIQAPVRTREGDPVVDNLGWFVLYHQQQHEAFSPVNGQIRGILLVIAIVLLLAAATAMGLSMYLVRPLARLTQTAEEVAGGNLDRRAQVTSSDEVGTLATALNTMTSRLQETLQSLEQRVAERTRNLELAAKVGRSVSQVGELSFMLRDACERILEDFDLYYVQVYLTNPAQTTLRLEAGTGEVGAQLLGRGHSLPVNTGSINGRAVVEKRTVVISDTAESTTFRPNPLLPDTHSEMAVPLIVADRVVGVLDMQSDRPGTLTEKVLPAFEALAGQLAVAIQNATLLAEAQQARAEVEAQARRLARTGWSEYLDAIHKPERIGFVFDRNQILELDEGDSSQAPASELAVSAPIAITGEALGSLVVEIDEEAKSQQTAELVNIVARQVAQQIENLRLLESAERYRYEAEQATRRQTIEGWQAYVNSRTADSLGYLFDLNEVRPHSNGHEEPSSLALPLKAHGETVGKLAVQGLVPEDGESLELANAVAEHLGAHIERLRLFEETKQGQVELNRRARQLAAVAEVSTASSKELDVQKMLEAVVHLTQRKFGLYHAHVFLFNEETGILKIAACGWKEGDPHEGTHGTAAIPIDQEQSLVARAGRTRQAVIVNDVHNEPGWLPNPLLPDTASEMAIPLLLGDRVLGVLDVQSDKLNAFTDEDANIQTTLASQVATALQNARTFMQAQKQAERESMLNVINQKIQSATSVEAVLQIAARELGHALGAPMTIAQLSMKDRSS